MPDRVRSLVRARPPRQVAGWLAALLLIGLGAAPLAHAQFSAAGSAAAESAAESATRRDEVASYGRRNVYRAGRTVRTGEPVEGDFHAAGSRVVVDAKVQGDALMLGGRGNGSWSLQKRMVSPGISASSAPKMAA